MTTHIWTPEIEAITVEAGTACSGAGDSLSRTYSDSKADLSGINPTENHTIVINPHNPAESFKLAANIRAQLKGGSLSLVNPDRTPFKSKVLIHLHNLDMSGANKSAIKTGHLLNELGFEVTFASAKDEGPLKVDATKDGFELLYIEHPEAFNYKDYNRVIANGIMSTKVAHQAHKQDVPASMIIHEGYSVELSHIAKFKEAKHKLLQICTNVEFILANLATVSTHELATMCKWIGGGKIEATGILEELKTHHRGATRADIANINRIFENEDWWEAVQSCLSDVNIIHVNNNSQELYIKTSRTIHECKSERSMSGSGSSSAGTSSDDEAKPEAHNSRNHNVVYNCIDIQGWKDKATKLAESPDGFLSRAMKLPCLTALRTEEKTRAEEAKHDESVAGAGTATKEKKKETEEDKYRAFRTIELRSIDKPETKTIFGMSGVVGSRKRQLEGIKAYAEYLEMLADELTTCEDDDRKAKLKDLINNSQLLIVGARGSAMDESAIEEAKAGEQEFKGFRLQEIKETNQIFEAISALASKLEEKGITGFAQRVHIIPETKQMWQYYALMDVMLQTSLSEQLSMAIAEASIVKDGNVFHVADDCAGTSDYIHGNGSNKEDQDTGILVPMDDLMLEPGTEEAAADHAKFITNMARGMKNATADLPDAHVERISQNALNLAKRLFTEQNHLNLLFDALSPSLKEQFACYFSPGFNDTLVSCSSPEEAGAAAVPTANTKGEQLAATGASSRSITPPDASPGAPRARSSAHAGSGKLTSRGSDDSLDTHASTAIDALSPDRKKAIEEAAAEAARAARMTSAPAASPLLFFDGPGNEPVVSESLARKFADLPQPDDSADTLEDDVAAAAASVTDIRDGASSPCSSSPFRMG